MTSGSLTAIVSAYSCFACNIFTNKVVKVHLPQLKLVDIELLYDANVINPIYENVNMNFINRYILSSK